jgi:hypothetical protein
METIETKRAIRQWVLEENALLIFEHDPRLSAGRLRHTGESFVVEAVDL